MKKEKIDTNGPNSFLQIAEKFSTVNESESEYDSEDTSTSSKHKNLSESENQIDAELESESENENQNENLSGSEKSSYNSEMPEKDEVVDDDEVEEPKKKKEIPYVFTEVSSKTLNKLKAKSKAPILPVKQDTAILYNKPVEKHSSVMTEKAKILMENTMRKLQKTHVWTPSDNERKNDKFNKLKYTQDNPNVDLFVTFLGYIRDSSYKQSSQAFEKIKEKYVK